MTGRLRAMLGHPVLVAAVVFALLPFALPAMGSTVTLATEIVIYALYGVGYNLLLGYTGLVSFGPSAYFGVASYAAGLAQLHLVKNVYLALVFGIGTAAVTGLALGLLILRRRGLYFSLLTLAFTQLLFEIAFHWTDFTGGENGLQGVTRPGLDDPLRFHFFCSSVVLAAMYVLWRIVHSPVGRVLQAIRDNEQRVQCLGYNTHHYKLLAFVLSSTFMGLAGALLTFLIQGVYADNLGWQRAGDPVLMTVLGGMHHFLGPLWGATVYILLSDQLSSYTEHWWLAFGALLIGFVLLSPEGLAGIYARLRRRASLWTLTRPSIPPAPPPGRVPSDGQPTAGRDGSVLVVEGLRKRFGSLVVADGVDLALRTGELHSLIGPNGAGKTTFFNMLTGLVANDGGRVIFDGQNISRMPVHERIRQGLSRSFQIVSVFKNLPVFENVRIAAQARSPRRFSLWRDAYDFDDLTARAWALLEVVGLAPRARQDAGHLAHGEQRLLEIAITLATDPAVLLLDEPLAGLTSEDRQRIGEVIRGLSGRHSILLIEHDIDRVLSLSDRITVLHQGRVIAVGPPERVVSDPGVITAYLGRRREAPPPALERAPSVAAGQPILRLANVKAGYGGSRVLDGVTLEVREGEVVALLGRNGVGKTTTLLTVMGVVKPTSGAVHLRGREISHWPPDRVNRLGISIVPEGRRIFPNLTVLHNLLLAQRPGGATVDEAFALFPKLRELQTARGENLSGGERQMLAIARALMAPTSLLLLDEPLEGLAPAVVDEVLGAIDRLRGRTSILLVEQKVDLVLQLADRAYVMVNGQIAHEGAAATLRDNEALKVRLLGV